jgi:endo-1,4-beta-xylanase
MKLPLLLNTLLILGFVSARATDTPAAFPQPRFVPMIPVNIFKGGPPIPDTPAVESPHPAAIALWPNGAPGSEMRKDEPEQISWRQEADLVFPIIFNIHNPSVTPYLPARDKATGAAVVIAPGGGNMQHTIDREGYNLGRWLADRGVAAFVLKYRLSRDAANLATGAAQPYTDHDAAADGARAIRLVRSRATEWGINPARIGIMGFSAGGAVVLSTATKFDAGKPDATDPVERVSSRPDFFCPIYTGGFTRVEAEISKANTPPAFLLCAVDDSMPEQMANFLVTLHKAGVNAELHIFNSGGHGFGVRTDRTLSVGGWPNLFLAWLNDRGFLKKE